MKIHSKTNATCTTFPWFWLHSTIFFLKISLNCHIMKASWSCGHVVLNSPKSTWFNLSYGSSREWCSRERKKHFWRVSSWSPPLFRLFQQQHYAHLCAGVRELIEVNTPLETHGIYCPGQWVRVHNGVLTVWIDRGIERSREDLKESWHKCQWGSSVHVFGLGGVIFIKLEHTGCCNTEIWTRSFTGSPPQQMSMHRDHLKVDKQEVQLYLVVFRKKRLLILSH